MFASKLNAQRQIFLSWCPDSDACGVHVFLYTWPQNNRHDFLPFSAMGIVLQKLRLEGGHLMLITPLWPTQDWFSQLPQMCTQTPIILPLRKDLLVLPQAPGTVHAFLKRFHLMASPSSDYPLQALWFQAALPPLSLAHVGAPPSSITAHYVFQR